MQAPLLSRVHLNGHTSWFNAQTQKLELLVYENEQHDHWEAFTLLILKKVWLT